MKCKEAGDQGSRSIGSLSAGLGSRSGTICPGTLSSASLLSEGGATPSSASGSVGFSAGPAALLPDRSEEHTSELQSLMRNSYAVCSLEKKTQITRLGNVHVYQQVTN